MSCKDYRDTIAAFIDGTLDAAGQHALERHVEGCAACRALVADLKSIQAAAFTLDRLEPPARAWEAIRARVAAEPQSGNIARVLAWPAFARWTGLYVGAVREPPLPRQPRPRTAWGVWSAAAAALGIATFAGLYPLLRDRGQQTTLTEAGPEGGDIVASVQAELEAAEAHYEKAIQGLEQIARRESGELDPQVAAVLQKNLQVIDQAIGESRAALKMQPASTDAQDSLFDAMRTKVAVLQQTVELINEMRKANPAGAGRLIQGIPQ